MIKEDKNMSSVTARIRQITQPRGGYIRPSQFVLQELDDGKVLNETENVHAGIIGMTVDYLTRYAMGAKVTEAFSISCLGAEAASFYGRNDAFEESDYYLRQIRGLDSNSIVNACKMVTFDVWYRNPMDAPIAKPASEINPDPATIQNIRIMVERSVAFWNEYGPIVKDGFTFEPTGYTETVDEGDGDFLTADTLWEFKVVKSKPTSKHTLQLLMYWIMGQHSGKAEFKGIRKLGIFNPRLNTIHTLRIECVPKDIIKIVESDVICY